MSTRPEALRLADELDQYLYSVPAHPLCTDAAAELRRLHAENASLSAALASSCDEQRHELWESGGVAGCERARVAERQRDTLLAEHQQTLALQQRSYEREIRLEVEAEREACAKLAESTVCDTHLPTGVRIYGTRAAAAIRARTP